MIHVLALLALTCGTERWAEKVLIDSDAKKVHPFAKAATIDELTGLPAPQWDNNGPRTEAERVTYKIQVKLIGAKLEADEDLHIVVADPADTTKTMIVEIPSAHCLEQTNKSEAKRIIAARTKFLTLLRVAAKFKTFKYPPDATIVGIAFFDKLHGQTGVAPNGVELHPVLDLKVKPL